MQNMNVKNQESYDVIGANLLNYYHRPVNGLHLSEDSTSESDEENYFPWIVNEESKNYTNIKFLDKETQTDYRESESQTDPWDPPFKVIKVNHEPEVLFLKQFTYGKGLPATMLEVDYIAEIRKNQKLLDEIKSKRDISKEKKKILNDDIKAKWAYKIATQTELQMEQIKSRQLHLVEEFHKKSEKREEKLRQMWNQKKENLYQQSLKLKEKLEKEKKNIENQYLGRKSPISSKQPLKLRENSSVIKSISREHVSHNDIDSLLNPYLLSNPEGLLTVKNWLEKKQTVLQNKVLIPKLSKRSQREHLADKAYEDILYKKRTKMPPKVCHEDYEKQEITLPTAKPEDITEYLDIGEEKIDMVTVLQQILRGLAHQKQMLQLIEKHKDGLAVTLSEFLSKTNNEN